MPVRIGTPEPTKKSLRVSKRTLIAMTAIIVVALGLAGGYSYFRQRNLSDMAVSYNDVKMNQQAILDGVEEDVQPVSQTVDNSLDAVHQVSSNEIAAAQLRDALGQSRATLIGGLWMPDIGLNLGVYSGFGGDNQYLGACTYTPNYERKMGSGNYVLVGHNSSNRNQLFAPLRKVTVGWLAYLTDYETVYTYKIVESDIVSQTRVDLVDDTEDPLLTLITCYGSNGTTQRRFVRCELVESKPLNESSAELQNHFIST